MLIYLVLLSVICIPLRGANVSVTLEPSSSSKSTSIQSAQTETNLSLITEGGKVFTEVPKLSLPKEKSTVLLTLDKELGNTKGKKPVKARKGALLEPDEVPKAPTILSKPSQKDRETDIVTKLITGETFKNKTSSSVPQSYNESTSFVNISDKTSVVTEQTVKVKKPRVLVYSDSDKINENPSLPEFKSSSKPVSDQIPSPNSKLHLKAKGTDPGMIMPIVITIVVVPAFALLAYMAVKRGREAWKNRHYKRMDFLLDGMYND